MTTIRKEVRSKTTPNLSLLISFRK